MFSSKWKLVGFVLYLAFRIAVRHPLPFAVVLVREAIECRAGSVADRVQSRGVQTLLDCRAAAPAGRQFDAGAQAEDPCGGRP